MTAEIRLTRLAQETLPLVKPFVIARGTRSAAQVISIELSDGTYRGRGECAPYGRFGETFESVIAQIESATQNPGADITGLPAGAARNALDCALWDLRARQSGLWAWQLAGLPAPVALTTALTLSLDEPAAMMRAAATVAARPLLKVKLGGQGDLARIAAVRAGAPAANIIVDANESWDIATYQTLVPQLAALGVSMIEQPFPVARQAALRDLPRPIPLCADESCADRSSLPDLVGLYDLINIKLDKCGGLTEALALRDAARALGFGIMVGCMISTSLSIAPAVLLAQGADVVDLDGPLWLRADRVNGLVYSGAMVHPARGGFWGSNGTNSLCERQLST